MIDLFKAKIEETLSKLIPSTSPFFPSLYEGGRYTLLAPGKRIRPLLTLAAAEMFEKEACQSALVPACSLELIHTYSLIHDDLPCMDNDDFRRGLPTLHRVYSEGHAVLIGDYLLTRAFEVLSQAPNLSDRQKILLIQKLAYAAGDKGMIGGQIMDIEGSKEIEEMHARKTAALFCVAIEFGGIVAEASPHELTLLHSFGRQFGLLFQTVDDLLDGDHPLGKDQAEASAIFYYDATLKALSHFPYDTTSLKKMCELVFSKCNGTIKTN
jgi:geranylgeranyl diphosphate synthase type II